MFYENQQIGYYTLVRFLGRGGFGEVWLAEKRDVSPPEKVAIKLPHNDQVDLPTIKDEIFNWILSGKHKNILPIIECETFGDQIAIVSEYAPDGSLRDLIEKHRVLPTAETVRITIEILNGLTHLHQRRIIHRDLKPENILMQGQTPRLTDFGIARAMANNNSTGVIMGTQAFMAPESFDGQRTVQTDIWSVGVILYLLLSGRLPFPQKEITALVGAIVMHDPPDLSSNTPNELQNIVHRALAKTPAKRFHSAEEMRDELNRIFTSIVTNENTIPHNFSTDQRTALLTPAQPQVAATEVITLPQKRKSKAGGIILIVTAFLLAFFGLAAYSIVRLSQMISQNRPATEANQNQPTFPSVKTANKTSPSVSNQETETRSDTLISNFSASIIDEAFAALEEKTGGSPKVTRCMFYKDKERFTRLSMTVKNNENDKYYDSFVYDFDKRQITSEPLKNPAFFETTGGRWFGKNDVNWNALGGLIQKIAAKAQEIGERGDDPSIIVTRKFIRFQPDTYGDVIFELNISGQRQDIELTADSNGENVKIKVD